MHIIEYRYRLVLGQQWTEWREHHAAESEAEAVEAVRYLEQSEREDRADGLLARFEETQYRIVEVEG